MPTQTFIAFDADDILGPNQPHFDRVEAQLLQILAPYADHTTINDRLYDVQRANRQLFGYGAKSFILSMLGFPVVHVPYHANWIHEHVPAELLAGVKFRAVERLREVLELVG